MQIKLQFLGAAQNVTGSRHLLQVSARPRSPRGEAEGPDGDGTNILVDCGLYQERQLKIRNWDPFPISPDSIDAVLLTHAHLDHCGLLPKLVREGFKGKIYCTAATSEIAQIILLDSAHLQEEDAEFKRKRHEREGRKGPYPEIPLYTVDEAEASFQHFKSIEYKKTIDIENGVEATFYDAGHVLGSSMIKVKIALNGQDRTVLFSGDVGRPHKPIVRDPSCIDEADYVLVESTYGDRVHQGPEDARKMIAKVINSTKKAGGNIIIPSFALERSQDVLYYINELMLTGAIPHLMVFLDSPMASSITKVFQKHIELYDKEMAEHIKHNESPFNFQGLKMAGTTDESKAINNIKGTSIIIAGSGMCTGGRVKHHLVNNITRPQSTIMFVGYQAVGTLGRRIVDGENKVRILGQEYPVKARIVQVGGFSSHADKNELLQWMKCLNKPPRKIFVVHGESDSAHQFGNFLREKTGWQVAVPAYQDEIILNG